MNPENEQNRDPQSPVSNDTNGEITPVPFSDFQAQHHAEPPTQPTAPVLQVSATEPYEQRAPHETPNAVLVRFFKSKRTWIISAVIFALLLLSVVFQLSYSSDRLAYNTRVDGVKVGGLRKADATELLNKTYGDTTFNIYLGKSESVFAKAKMSEAGIDTLNRKRVDQINYPWYMRLIPTSIFWAGSSEGIDQPSFSYDTDRIANFVEAKFGKDCKVLPKGATLKVEDTSLRVVKSVQGGICEREKVEESLTKVQPTLDDSAKLDIETIPLDAVITNEIAQRVATTLNQRFEVTMPLVAGKDTKDVTRAEALGWLDFTPYIPKDESDPKDLPKITYAVNEDRLKAYLDQEITRAVSVKAGANKVSTLDFKETSRVNAKPGIGIDITKTAASVDDYIAKKSDKATVVTKVVPASTDYKRSYTQTNRGFSALLSQFAKDNKGILSASFVQLRQKDRLSAQYKANKVLPAAGIENLYVEYATLVAVENNVTYWAERILGPMTVEDCFDRVIKTNDRECSEALIKRLSFAYVTTRLSDAGLKHTSFAGVNPTTTASDLTQFLRKIGDGEIDDKVGNQLLGHMKNTRSRDGIPEGVLGNPVSNSVGERDTVINEAAFVYSKKNNKYILTVMTDGSNWEAVAKLGTLVQELHARK